MFKIDDVVITPNEMPAVITEVLNNGLSYEVAEMPKLTEDQVKNFLLSGNQFIESESNTYSINELRIPTEQEQESLKNVFARGANMPSVH